MFQCFVKSYELFERSSGLNARYEIISVSTPKRGQSASRNNAGGMKEQKGHHPRIVGDRQTLCFLSRF